MIDLVEYRPRPLESPLFQLDAAVQQVHPKDNNNNNNKPARSKVTSFVMIFVLLLFLPKVWRYAVRKVRYASWITSDKPELVCISGGELHSPTLHTDKTLIHLRATDDEAITHALAYHLTQKSKIRIIVFSSEPVKVRYPGSSLVLSASFSTLCSADPFSRVLSMLDRRVVYVVCDLSNENEVRKAVRKTQERSGNPYVVPIRSFSHPGELLIRSEETDRFGFITQRRIRA